MKTLLKFCIVSFFLLPLTNSAYSQRIDIEIDPIAWALKGFSVHAGLNTENISFDIGLFGIEVPESFHGNDGCNFYMWGGRFK